MKTIGMIGGIGPESTIDYYRRLVAAYRERRTDGSYPPILINSINLQQMLRLIDAGELERLTGWLGIEIEKLANAGAQIGLLASNTPHLVFDELRSRSRLPLVSIVEATCAAADKLQLCKLGLFGARYTMQGSFYPDVFAKNGIALIAPRPDEQTWIHDHYMNELVKGVFLPETRDGFLRVAERLRRDDHIEGLILGGTELPLILRDVQGAGIPFLDTTQIHVDAVMAQVGL